MRQSSLHRQKGAAALVLVVVASILALSVVLGYSTLFAKTQLNAVEFNQRQYLADYAKALSALYERRAAAWDGDAAPAAGPTAQQIPDSVGLPKSHGLEIVVSRRLSGPDGLKFRRIALYLPSASDADNPPDIAGFQSSGVWRNCSNTALPCDPRPHVLVDGLDIQRALLLRTLARLEAVASKAQAFFKAKALLDPERNITVNHFRPPFGGCTPGNNELPCLDAYTMLSATDLPAMLGLAPSEVLSAWGDPIEASNSLDSSTTEPPYSMTFRVATPFGAHRRIAALQPL